MSEATHPGHAAINLHAQYETHKNAAIQKRASAADMRRRAKACALKADAFALRAQAKPISAEAAQSTSSASKTLNQFLDVAAQTQQLLSKRMPPRVATLGCDQNACVHQHIDAAFSATHTQASKTSCCGQCDSALAFSFELA